MRTYDEMVSILADETHEWMMARREGGDHYAAWGSKIKGMEISVALAYRRTIEQVRSDVRSLYNQLWCKE